MLGREPPKKTRSAPCRLDEDPPPVRRVAPPARQTGSLATVDQADGALVLDLEFFGEFLDGGRPSRRAADEQEKLVLRRGHAGRSRKLLRGAEKSPQRAAPIGQRPVVRVSQPGDRRFPGLLESHPPILTYRDTICLEGERTW